MNARQSSGIKLQDAGSSARQESVFVVLNLVVLAAIILIHTAFASHFGTPSPRLIVVLAAAFLLRLLQLLWVHSRTQAFDSLTLRVLTAASVVVNMALAFTLATLTDRPDSPYFVLLAPPVIEAAFRFRLKSTLTVIVAAGALNFFWVSNYARIHSPTPVSEYFEAGTVSIIYALVGVLVWVLVNHLQDREARLAKNLAELQKTRERLVQEERLAAVGEMASAIAHEIRNPVAMISTSMVTARRKGLAPEEREEMFEIASKEAQRLERLTNDFLAYARPRTPQKEVHLVADTLAYVADVSRAYAEQKKVRIQTLSPEDLTTEFDPASVQQALLNLVMNAVDAADSGSVVNIEARSSGDWVHVNVRNTGAPVPTEIAAHIFEPFYTTKPCGSGLGLAIARKIAVAHGGDIQLTENQSTGVCFSLVLPASSRRMAKEMTV